MALPDPSDPTGLQLTAEARLKKVERMLKRLAGCQKLSHGSLAYVYSALGALSFARGDYISSIEHCRQALEHDKEYAVAYYNLGNAYWATDQRDKAFECFIKAYELRQGDPFICNNLAVAYLSVRQKRDPHKAVKILAEVVQHTKGEVDKVIHTNLDFARMVELYDNPPVRFESPIKT